MPLIWILISSFYCFVCLSGYLESSEKSWSALQGSHCSEATDADRKVKANTHKSQQPRNLSSSLRGAEAGRGEEAKHINTSLSCSSNFLLENSTNSCTELIQNMGAPGFHNY